MRLVTFEAAGAPPAVGVWTDDDRIVSLYDLGQAADTDLGAAAGMKAYLAQGKNALARTAQALETHGRNTSSAPRSSVALLSPILDPGMVLSASMSYKAHLSEMGVAIPPEPTAFLKSPGSVIGADEAIPLPADHPDMVDYEGEFSCVFGARCHKVSADHALDFVAGLTLVNDVSARDWAMQAIKGLNGDNAMAAKLSWDINIMGKQYPGFCPVGPAITTLDAMGDPTDLVMETWVNDKRVQHTSTGDLAWSLAEMIAYFSQWYVFQPGDVLTTGSPSGVGFGRKPQLFLRNGDTVIVRMDGIGDLANKVVQADAAAVAAQ